METSGLHAKPYVQPPSLTLGEIWSYDSFAMTYPIHMRRSRWCFVAVRRRGARGDVVSPQDPQDH